MKQKIQPGPGQESVWDYPRPPVIRGCNKQVGVILCGEVIAYTSNALCVLETSHPPTYYIPPDDINTDWLLAGKKTSFCEWKGSAVYFDIHANDKHYKQVAWAYPDPAVAFASLKDHVAFYAQYMDACYVGDERVLPQPGEFYGGWITSGIVGPFKGEPGSAAW